MYINIISPHNQTDKILCKGTNWSLDNKWLLYEHPIDYERSTINTHPKKYMWAIWITGVITGLMCLKYYTLRMFLTCHCQGRICCKIDPTLLSNFNMLIPNYSKKYQVYDFCIPSNTQPSPPPSLQKKYKYGVASHMKEWLNMMSTT